MTFGLFIVSLKINISRLCPYGLAFASLLALSVQAQENTQTLFPVTPLSAGIQAIQAEIASTEPQRERGLMFRPALGGNQGMVFLFEAPNVECMWMKNTLIPLSVAFISSDGTIVNIEDMQAQTETSHCAAKPVIYALEMNLGWFAKHGIKPGMKINGIPKL